MRCCNVCIVASWLAAQALCVPASMQGSPTSESPAFTTSMDLTLNEYWNLYVGPIAEAATTTTVAPTSVPSNELIPPPPLYYSAFPPDQQVPMTTKNSSWAFPSDFFWGVASAAYQIEGGAKAEGRGPSIWDVLSHRVPGYIKNGDTGDIGDNQYFLYKQDIARIAALGVPYYSFSISWSRIFPYGRGQINEAGLAHYDDLIETCLQYNVQPVVTLYHWDLPLYLQNLYGGWLGSDIVDDFTAYAKVAFERWGSKVKHWFTVNEPIVFCTTYPLPSSYFTSTKIPAAQQPYWCGQHVLLAHAAAYRLAKSLPNFIGTVSFKTNGGYKIPLTPSADDAAAVERAWAFNEGWFADPVFLTGDYPAQLKSYVSAFLPPFTAAQKRMINGSADFFAHDAYTSNFVYAPHGGVAACVASNGSNAAYPGCYETRYDYSPADGAWAIGPAADPGSPWLHKATDWVPVFLRFIMTRWRPAGGVALTEIGFSEPYEELRTNIGNIRMDALRSAYYQDYLEAVLMAISEGTKVIGCLAWSIMDNLEWQEGYTVKFGMQHVDLNSPARTRIYKASFFWYVDMFKQYMSK